MIIVGQPVGNVDLLLGNMSASKFAHSRDKMSFLLATTRIYLGKSLMKIDERGKKYRG